MLIWSAMDNVRNFINPFRITGL